MISPNECKFEYKDSKLLLVEKAQGVYGLGKAVLLYSLNGVEKNFIKTIGWTQSDNHGGPDKESVLGNRIVAFDECKLAALKYVQALLD